MVIYLLWMEYSFRQYLEAKYLARAIFWVEKRRLRYKKQTNLQEAHHQWHFEYWLSRKRHFHSNAYFILPNHWPVSQQLIIYLNIFQHLIRLISFVFRLQLVFTSAYQLSHSTIWLVIWLRQVISWPYLIISLLYLYLLAEVGPFYKFYWIWLC